MVCGDPGGRGSAPHPASRVGHWTKPFLFRRFAAASTPAALLISVCASTVAASTVAGGGPPSLAFYVDDVRFRTVGTPIDFTNTGAPNFNDDEIHALRSGLMSGTTTDA